MARGGLRFNPGGRPKGKSKKTIALDEVAALQAAGGYLSPVKFLLDVMRDVDEDIAIRVHCAVAAACYTNKKKPQGIEHSGGMTFEPAPVNQLALPAHLAEKMAK